jgi:imidazolonepropionase-like amidohydrolase
MNTSGVAIVGGLLLNGPSLEPFDATLQIIDGRIEQVDGPLPPDLRVVDATGLTILPGFIDAHVHIAFYEPHDVLTGGVTTVRDLAWPPAVIFELAQRSRDVDFDGPEILAAGPMLTTAGGYPTSAGWAPPGTARVVAGPADAEAADAEAADAEAAVTEAADAGACIIKVALNPPAGPTLDTPTLAAIVSAAHARGLKVTGHVSGLDQLDKCLHAGVDELAHALMSEERIPAATLDRMVEQGMVIVPTFSCRTGSDLEMAIENVARFRAAGGTVIYGTDLGNEGPVPGIDASEVSSMMEAGMSGLEIVRSATCDSARWLGLTDRGVIQPGARADLIGVSGDPSEDPTTLSNVRLVIRGGRIVKES